MKKLLSVLVLFALAFSLVSCSSDDDGPERNEDGLIIYAESGLNFALPDEMTERNVNYADICYGDGEAEFFVFFYSRDSLLTECFLSKDATVKEYAEWCIDFSSCTEVTEEYDEEGRRIKYIFVADDTYYIAVIMRNNDSLIHVTMCCPQDMRDAYIPEFAVWEKHVSLMYPDN